jgi:hypothetical protein
MEDRNALIEAMGKGGAEVIGIGSWGGLPAARL